MFNDLSSPLSLLSTRRSGKPRDMIAPGPDDAQLRQILGIAARTPDHGKLAPWRFVTIGSDQRDILAAKLREAYLVDKPNAGRLELDSIDAFAREAPCLVVVLSAPIRDSHIPVWEQELSAGAVCMNMLTAAHAMGFVASWLTGWAAFSDQVRDLFGGPETRIAGFIFIGSPSRPLDERPRPQFDAITKKWDPPTA
ncbi:MAG: nitroreductase [Sphingomonadaceae bacterium]